MMKEAVSAELARSGIVAILRGIEAAALPPLVAALYEGGIRLAEVTLNSPSALAGIAALRQAWGERMYIGAGTVLDAPSARAAMDAGAQFIVAPNVAPDVIACCQAQDRLVLPGALTPTEIALALRLGCTYVKLFPARAMGPQYVRDVLGPLDGAKLLVVGGIDDANLPDYLAQGAVGAGVGGRLCRTPADGDYAPITAQARRLVAACARRG